MKKRHFIVVVQFFLLLLLCRQSPDVPAEIIRNYPESFSFRGMNELPVARTDAEIVLHVEDLQKQNPEFNPLAFVIFSEGEEIASQSVDIDDDGQPENIMAVADFNANESKDFLVFYAREGKKNRSYIKRTQAELSRKVGGEFRKNKKGRYEYMGGEFQNVDFLRVPPKHSDHSWFIRYEGPGWESDKVGYRFYLDWRNATDIFGKKTPDMVLQHVGLDGFDSYHEMSDWGMDILKVGDALGVGGIGMWEGEQAVRVSETDSLTCRIISDGPVYSRIRTMYYGWKTVDGKYNLVSDLSIWAGSRLTEHTVRISNEPPNFCTGIVKHPGVSYFQNPDGGTEWSYMATYGKQSLAEDNLGMAVLYRTDQVKRVTEDQNNYVVILDPVDGRLTYYFLAAWEQEPGGIVSENQFKAYLKEVVLELENPIQIVFN